MLKVDYEQKDSTHILKLDGILDISTIDVLDELDLVHKADQWESSDTLLIDFTHLHLIDSTGISAILRLIHLSKDKGFKVRLEGMNQIIQEILDTVGVLKILETLKGDS